jgi:hypothetical protein
LARRRNANRRQSRHTIVTTDWSHSRTTLQTKCRRRKRSDPGYTRGRHDELSRTYPPTPLLSSAGPVVPRVVVRNSTNVTMPMVTRARRRQVVGPTPKPHCRRLCGNAARAAALGLCFPPPCVKDGTKEVEGAPPWLERVLALWHADQGGGPTAARRCLCRENVGYERVYSPTPARPSSRSRTSAWRARAAIRAHQTRAPRQGEARAPQSGARASSPHAQGPGGPLGARRWRSPLSASGQYVADTCTRGGGGPLGLSWP